MTSLKPRSAKGSVDNGSASPTKSQPSPRAGGEHLKHPSFKDTLTSVFSSAAKTQDDHELSDQPPFPRRDYALLDEESVGPRRSDTTRELGQTPPMRIATIRDSLER